MRLSQNYENLNYAAVIRTATALADLANRYVEQNQPWTTIKTDPEKARTTLTATLNAVRILTIYLKPVLPAFAEKVERLLNIGKLTFADINTTLQEHNINDFERLFERVDKEKVDAMIEESKDTGDKPMTTRTDPGDNR